MAAVIDRAIDDIIGKERCRPKETDQAMAFILGETCEAYCLELKIDYERIKREAVILYRRFLDKIDKGIVKDKRRGRPAKRLQGVQIRQSPGKRLIGTDKHLVGHLLKDPDRKKNLFSQFIKTKASLRH